MVGEQMKMLSYVEYTLAIGLHIVDGLGAKAADSADRAPEAIEVGLWAIEHVALKVRVNLELAMCDKALPSFPSMLTIRRSYVPCPWVTRGCLGASWMRPQSKPKNDVITNVN